MFLVMSSKHKRKDRLTCRLYDSCQKEEKLESFQEYHTYIQTYPNQKCVFSTWTCSKDHVSSEWFLRAGPLHTAVQKKHNVANTIANSILIISKIDAMHSIERVLWRHDGNKSFLARLEPLNVLWHTTSAVWLSFNLADSYLWFLALNLEKRASGVSEQKCVHLVHLGNM